MSHNLKLLSFYFIKLTWVEYDAWCDGVCDQVSQCQLSEAESVVCVRVLVWPLSASLITGYNLKITQMTQPVRNSKYLIEIKVDHCP